MFGLAFLVFRAFGLVASVAASATLEVVVLALSTDPPTIREVKGVTGFLRDGLGIIRLILSSLSVAVALGFTLSFLVLAPL